tara:strand:- start:403 stop:573 length:171 start_codon:yes stop_codon:yes gene_type:complete
MLTEEQFVEIVSEVLNQHISRDPIMTNEDMDWEARNAARAIAKTLRIYGLRVPAIE